MVITKFNYIKLEMQDGWFTYSNPSKPKLQKLISRNPKNIYVSVNKFLSYKEHNSTYKFQNRIMFRYGLIDIDSQDFSSKEEAIDYFNEIILFLQKKKIKISEINATNIFGGFQVIIHPDSYKKFKYILTSSLLRDEKLFKRIDWKVMDDKRVRRYAPSWNNNKNSPVIPLFKEEISLPFGMKTAPNVFNERQMGEQIPPLQSQDLNNREIIPFQDLSPRYEIVSNGGFHSLGMPLDMEYKADDNEVVESTPPRSEQRQGQAVERKLPCRFLVRQISSSVSPNNYVPVLKFPIKPSLKRIRRLQRAYSMGDVYLLQTHMGFMAISPKTAQKERLYKIYKKAGCWKSLNELQKFKQNWIFCSNIYNLNQRKSIESIRLLDILEQEADGFYSYPHSLFLKKYLNKNYPNLIGTKPKVYTALFSRD